MKIYLRNLKTFKWELKEGSLKDLKKELDLRSIVISVSASVGDYASVGNNASVGDNASVGNNASIGNYVSVGYSASVGDYARVGNNARVGDYARVGNNVSVGYNASVGDNASIGNYASVGKLEVFTKEYIYIQLGILPDDKGYYTLFKAVTPDLKDFYSEKYQYKLNKGDKSNEIRNQDKNCGDNCWHFTNLWGAISFADKKPHKIISAKIHIDNILSVYDKVRVNKFSNVKIVDIDFKGK